MDGPILLVHAPWIVMLARLLDAREKLREVVAIALQDDDDLARVFARPPEEMRLVRADRRGQPVSRPEQIDGAGLAVVLCEDRRPGSLVGRQGVIDARNVGDQLLPPELVPEQLRQRTPVHALRLGRRETEARSEATESGGGERGRARRRRIPREGAAAAPGEPSRDRRKAPVP